MLTATMKFLFIFASSSSIAWGSVETCGTIDLRKDPRAQLILPVRNQGDIAWCYAHAAADMISYHYSIESLSVLHLASLYNTTPLARTMKWGFDGLARLTESEYQYREHETGFLKIALQETLKTGICSERVIPSDRATMRTGSELSAISVLDAFREIRVLRRQSRASQSTESKTYLLGNMNEGAEELSDSQFRDIIFQKSSSKVVYDLATHACGNQAYQFEPQVLSQIQFQDRLESFFRSSEISKKLDAALERKEWVGIDYFSSVLNDLDQRIPAHMHTSIVVGRRLNTGTKKCEYLIRNSWGPECDRKVRPYDSRIECEEGYLWVPQSSLMRNVIDLVYFN